MIFVVGSLVMKIVTGGVVRDFRGGIVSYEDGYSVGSN